MDEIQKGLLEKIADIHECRKAHIISAQTDS